VRALGPEARNFQLDITSPSGLPEGEFDPAISLFRDERQAPLAAPKLLRIGRGTLSDVLLPGTYMLLISNPVGTPAEYRLVMTSTPVG
jgi:hypothetical protein